MLEKPADAQKNTSKLLPLDQYDAIIVAFSGGKDSLACALHLMDLGVKFELWHHAIDGRPGQDRLFDWPVTETYCEAVARALGAPLLFQWREGGFRREMLRDNQATAPVTFQLHGGGEKTVGGKGPLNTRRKFPQVSADLSVRWCSSALKIDVATRTINNDPRFANAKILILTGERREESGPRSRYAEVSEHTSTTRNRRVDQWRAVLNWEESEIWEIIERHRIRPHPAYFLGWSRVSCATCIFGDPTQWATARQVLPEQFHELYSYEREFGVTIRRDGSIIDAANRAGTVSARGKNKGEMRPLSYLRPGDDEMISIATAEHYPFDAALEPGEKWVIPRGAYGHSGGPT